VFVVASVGIRGEERKPDARHHTVLPFTRLLQGSADYTPRYLQGAGVQCTKVHQLALPIVIYSPIQSLFWAEPVKAVSDGAALYFPELKVWSALNATWLDSRVLSAKLGEYVCMARLSTIGEWFVGCITNSNERRLKVNLEPLFDEWVDHPNEFIPRSETGYFVHVYKDGQWKGRKDLFTVRTQPRRSMFFRGKFFNEKKYDELKVPKTIPILDERNVVLEMAPSGGQVFWIQAASPSSLAFALSPPKLKWRPDLIKEVKKTPY